MAMPPGPAATTLIKLNLTHYKKHILTYATGVAFLDIIYCLVAMLAATQLLAAYQFLDKKYPVSIFIFQGTIVLFLIAFGIKNLIESNRINEFNPSEPIKVKKN